MNFAPCAVALKEWDAQVAALLAGQVSVLARKGGIVEARSGFEVAHQAFWLYPTFLHQNPSELCAGFEPHLRPNPAPGEVTFNAFATVEGVLKLESLPEALNLEPVQALNAGSLERRFAYKNRPVIHALLLRVYSTAPHLIQETEEYAGCVSWVNLETALAVQDAQPVLEDAAFSQLRADFERRFGRSY